MGKSPGKWIKTLFGKKSSKSNLSKGRESLKTTSENGALAAAKSANADFSVVSPSISQPASVTVNRNEVYTELEKGVPSNTEVDGTVLVPGIQDVVTQGITGAAVPHDPERSMQEHAATKAQAAFRGYLARRAFRALRGIIRLQALVRGHLVRRQAVATLFCIQGIVKLQALFRGKKVRNSDTVLQVRDKCSLGKPLDANLSNCVRVKPVIWMDKPSRFVFISKILTSSPLVMPLHLQYGLEEPNSAWNWLMRWTISCSWKPLPQLKKILDSKSQRREGSFQNVETEASRPKRSVRKVSSSYVDNGSVNPHSESGKTKRNLRKAPNHSVDPVQERSQNELDKVKRNLRKLSSSAAEATNQPETEMEKPKRSMRKASSSTSPDVPDQGMGEFAEKKMEDATVNETSKQPDTESTSTPLAAIELDGVLHDDHPHPSVELPPLQSRKVDDNENIPVTNGELISKEDQTSNENQKTSRRRASFPAKQEYPENGLQNSPTVPSYMAATESAKAKLRAQGSPRVCLDGDEKNSFTRRHSLPSAPNGKLSSESPRTQRLVQASGKGGAKNDRSPLLSKDDKVVQAEWKR